MANERYRRRASIAEEFDTSLMYDDVEKIREREEEEEKDQNSKLGSAGMMAMAAGAGLLIATLFSEIGFIQNFFEAITIVLPILGFGALGYGFFKTIQLAFRQKELNFPALNVYRKTRPAATMSGEENSEQSRTYRNRTADREQNSYRYQRRTASRESTRSDRTQRKSLKRSRTDRVFSGVAGGIAEYTGISSALIRFAFIFSIIPTSGMSIFLYLLFSIILPANYDRFEQEFPYGEGDANKTA
ncbi:MAG: PspC domain-containing protein [Bacteroidia bacterium]|nr:PspC domain-containing protein [Bacteroidia bacterium]